MIPEDIQRDLAACLRLMGRWMDSGRALVPSLELGIRQATQPRVRQTLQAMLDGWWKERNILPPAEKATDVFPRSACGFTMAGFDSWTLGMTWPRAADLMEWRLKHADGEAAFCMTLGALMQSGTPIVFSFDAIAADCESPEMRTIAAEMKAKVLEGQSISGIAAAHSGFFSKELAPLIEKTEQDGTLGEALFAYARKGE